MRSKPRKQRSKTDPRGNARAGKVPPLPQRTRPAEHVFRSLVVLGRELPYSFYLRHGTNAWGWAIFGRLWRHHVGRSAISAWLVAISPKRQGMVISHRAITATPAP